VPGFVCLFTHLPAVCCAVTGQVADERFHEMPIEYIVAESQNNITTGKK
jgi:hypothetical protein